MHDQHVESIPVIPQTALTVRRSPLEQIREVATYLKDLDDVAAVLCKSTILPAAMQNPANLKLVLLQGLAMGFDVVQSIRASFIIQTRDEPPKVGYYVDSLVALVRSSPKCKYFIVEESTASQCIVRCARTDEPEKVEHRFQLTMEQAHTSGLDQKWSKDRSNQWVSEIKYMWKANPGDMLNARCCGRAVKRTFQDVVFGMSTPDELEDIVIADRERSGSGYAPPPMPVTDAEIVVEPAQPPQPDDRGNVGAEPEVDPPSELDVEMSRLLKIVTSAKTRDDLAPVGALITAAKMRIKNGDTEDAYSNAILGVVEPMLQRVWRSLSKSTGRK